jgi:hypothetical protein
MTLLYEARGDPAVPIAPTVVDLVRNERAQGGADATPGASVDVAAFSAPPPPSATAQLLAWLVLTAMVASFGWVIFLL